MQRWRLIEDISRSGSFNMAADEFLLRSFHAGDSPTFRLYTWNQATLSLGRNETLDEQFNLEWCQQRNIPLIRRTTGGKAVLHGSDLTYSIVAGVQDPQFTGGVLAAYRSLARGFYLFFEQLQLAPELKDTKASQLRTHLCFSDPATYEILVEGKKIIGNAQRVIGCQLNGHSLPGVSRPRVFLQHGSIPLQDQIPTLAQIFRNVVPNTLRKEMISLEATGTLSRYSIAEIRHFLLTAMRDIFQIEWNVSPWTREELQLIAQYETSFAPLNCKEEIT